MNPKQKTLFQSWNFNNNNNKPVLPQHGVGNSSRSGQVVVPDQNYPLSTTDFNCFSNCTGFDVDAGKTWIYPTNYPIRDYQMTIVREALFRNTMVVLPTGLGKTFIAAVVMFNMYRWYPQGKVIFMAPTRPLVTQQMEACFKITGIPESDTAVLTGANLPAIRKHIWDTKRVFFLTPHTLANDIARNFCSPLSIKCLVIDEAHKATGNYAYCEVIRQLCSSNGEFRILALTATPGSDIKSVKQVLSNLLISHVALRTEESADVKPYIHDRNIEKIIVPLGNEMTALKEKVLDIIDGYLKRLTTRKALSSRNPSSLSKFQLVKLRDAFVQCPPQQLDRHIFGLCMADFGLLISLYHAFELLLHHGVMQFFQFMTGVVAGEKSIPYARSELMKNMDFEELMHHVRDTYFCLAPQPTPDQNTSNFILKDRAASHPKMVRLQQIVLDHFLSCDPSKTRVMIFSQYRSSVKEIEEMFARHDPTIRVMCFVGQMAKSGSTGAVTQKQQLHVVRKFREGGYNTLVSTCVGEEGLDIGEVDLIVCYDCPRSPIRLVQRMGRTGRQRQGRVVMLVTEGKEDQVYKSSVYQKDWIYNAIKKGILFENLNKNSPRMVPNGIFPECDKQVIVPVQNHPAAKKQKVIRNTKRSTLNDDEKAYLQEHFKVDIGNAPLLPTSKFLTLPKANQEENTETPATNEEMEKPLLSLNRWMQWQTVPQQTHAVSHSSKTVTIVEVLNFIKFPETIPNYGAKKSKDINTIAYYLRSNAKKDLEKQSQEEAAKLQEAEVEEIEESVELAMLKYRHFIPGESLIVKDPPVCCDMSWLETEDLQSFNANDIINRNSNPYDMLLRIYNEMCLEDTFEPKLNISKKIPEELFSVNLSALTQQQIFDDPMDFELNQPQIDFELDEPQICFDLGEPQVNFIDDMPYEGTHDEIMDFSTEPLDLPHEKVVVVPKPSDVCQDIESNVTLPGFSVLQNNIMPELTDPPDSVSETAPVNDFTEFDEFDVDESIFANVAEEDLTRVKTPKRKEPTPNRKNNKVLLPIKRTPVKISVFHESVSVTEIQGKSAISDISSLMATTQKKDYPDRTNVISKNVVSKDPSISNFSAKENAKKPFQSIFAKIDSDFLESKNLRNVARHQPLPAVETNKKSTVQSKLLDLTVGTQATATQLANWVGKSADVDGVNESTVDNRSPDLFLLSDSNDDEICPTPQSSKKLNKLTFSYVNSENSRSCDTNPKFCLEAVTRTDLFKGRNFSVFSPINKLLSNSASKRRRLFTQEKIASPVKQNTELDYTENDLDMEFDIAFSQNRMSFRGNETSVPERSVCVDFPDVPDTQSFVSKPSTLKKSAKKLQFFAPDSKKPVIPPSLNETSSTVVPMFGRLSKKKRPEDLSQIQTVDFNKSLKSQPFSVIRSQCFKEKHSKSYSSHKSQRSSLVNKKHESLWEDEEDDFTFDLPQKKCKTEEFKTSTKHDHNALVEEYIEQEAEILDQVSSDELESSQMNVYEQSFINDKTALIESDVDERAMYMRSTKAFVGCPQRYKTNLLKRIGSPSSRYSTYSNDEDYERDSFCVGSDVSSSPDIVTAKKKKKKIKKRKRILISDSDSSDDLSKEPQPKKLGLGPKSPKIDVLEPKEINLHSNLNKTISCSMSVNNAVSPPTCGKTSLQEDVNNESDDYLSFDVFLENISHRNKTTTTDSSAVGANKGEKETWDVIHIGSQSSKSESKDASLRENCPDDLEDLEFDVTWENTNDNVHGKATMSNQQLLQKSPVVHKTQYRQSETKSFTHDSLKPQSTSQSKSPLHRVVNAIKSWFSKDDTYKDRSFEDNDFVNSKSETKLKNSHSMEHVWQVNHTRPATSDTSRNSYSKSSGKTSLTRQNLDIHDSVVKSTVTCDTTASSSSSLTVLVSTKELARGKSVINKLKSECKIQTIVMPLPHADYIVSNRIAVERIYSSEILLQASLPKALKKIKSMKDTYEKGCVIIEQDNRSHPSLYNQNFDRRLLLSLIVWQNSFLKVLFSESDEETSKLINNLALNEKKSNMHIDVPVDLAGSAKERFDFLCKLPHVNPVCALNLAHKYPALSDIFKCSPGDLKKAGFMSTSKAHSLHWSLKASLRL